MRHRKTGEQLQLFFEQIADDITQDPDTQSEDAEPAVPDEPAAASQDKGLDLFTEEIQGRMTKAEAAERIEEIRQGLKKSKRGPEKSK